MLTSDVYSTCKLIFLYFVLLYRCPGFMTDKKNRIKLFSEFPPVSTQEWKSRLEHDLKGIPYDKLIWKSIEGIDVHPFYREEDLAGKDYLQSLPGEYPFIRGNKVTSNDWEIRQDIHVSDIRNANTTALDALDRGAGSLGFIIPPSLNFSRKEFTLLLQDIHIDSISLNFIGRAHAPKIIEFLKEQVLKKGIDPSHINGSVDIDPLGYLSVNGKFFSSEKEEFDLCTEMISRATKSLPNLRVIGINTDIFHNAGGSSIQELGLGLAMISDYMDRLSDNGIDPKVIAHSMQLNFAVGSSYFMEIAKLRAARLLFARLVKAWNVDDEKFMKIFIHCRTSEWTQTIYESSINILRSTTQAMSAILGGADSVQVIPYDHAYGQPDTFSERIARNIQIILKEEAYFNKVIDPSSGSYYIETLTDSLAEKAWHLFLEIEDQGGYFKTFKNGYIRKLIIEKSKEKDLNLSHRKDIMVGINQFIDQSEKIPDVPDSAAAFAETKQDHQFIAPPLYKYRKSILFEEIRLRTARSKSGAPEVFLLPFGKPALRRARAEFSANFFACGGFKIIDHHGFHSIKDGIESLKKTKAHIVVFCSSDEEYMLLTSDDIRELGREIIPVVAGNPKEATDELRSRGIDHFIHIKSDIVEELKNFQELLGL